MLINNKMEKYSLLYSYSEIPFNELLVYVTTGINFTNTILNKISQAQMIHSIYVIYKTFKFHQ